MNTRIWLGLGVIGGMAVLLLTVSESLGEPPPGKGKDDADQQSERKLSVADARRQAKLLHTTYESTLIAVHRAYFEEGERKMVPARVLEDVFFWVDREMKGKTRWIAVNTKAMNIDHEPDSDFEKQAAKVLAGGKDEFETVKDGVYHRAGAVTLVASCLRCHESALIQKRSRRRVAALVISLPVTEE